MSATIVSSITCTTCRNGSLVFMKKLSDDRLFLECDECMTGYWDADDLRVTFRGEDAEWDSTFATMGEIEGRGWAGYVLRLPT